MTDKPEIENNEEWTCPHCQFVDVHEFMASPSSSYPVTDIMRCVSCGRDFFITWYNGQSAGVVSS